MEWTAVISAVCSVISLVAIIILLKERTEKKRPYLQVSFELIKSSLVCLVIRNTGETPAKLKTIRFNKEFVSQLPEHGQVHAQDRDELNISIYPKQQWVICLDVITPTVLSYQNTQLEVVLEYRSKEKRKKYIEKETVEFNDYTGFLVYISEIDELKSVVKKLGENLVKVDRSLLKIANASASSMQTESYANLGENFNNTLVTGASNEPPILREQKEDTQNAD